MTLRDELAAVLGPGNDDRVAYGQADGVLDLLRDKAEAADLSVLVDEAWRMAGNGPYPPD